MSRAITTGIYHGPVPPTSRPTEVSTATSDPGTATDPHRVADPWARLPRWVRIALPGIALLAAYWLLTLLNSPDGFLGTDTGGKVATLKAMAANHTYTNVDVGYWAQQWDPTGRLHPLLFSLHVGNHWVQVTTLPMLLAGEPLYRLGGYRLALALPMLGAVACAYAARALAARFGGDHTRRWWAFWIVGLASPVVIYALDFWEHTIGLALMAWGVIALLDLLEATSTRRRTTLAGLAGLAFGAAATMRTEALVYLAIAAVVIAVVIFYRHRRIIGWIGAGIGLVVGALVPLAANRALSQWILGDGLRENRASGAAGGFGSDPVLRLKEGLVTTFGLTPSESATAIGCSILAAALIAYAVARGRRRDRPLDRPVVLALLVCVAVLYVVALAPGLGWVSGIVGAAPLAAAGAVAAWRRPLRRPAAIATIIALVALPVVWGFQYTGGAGPQWGGRYVLLTMFVLVVAAVVALPSLKPPIPQFLVGLSVVVTVFGLAWMSVRTHDVARTFTALEARPEPVLVADGALGFYPREGGAFYGDHRWLTAPGSGDRARAARVVADAGFDEFALVSLSPHHLPDRIGSFKSTATSKIEAFTGVAFTITTYRSAAPSS